VDQTVASALKAELEIQVAGHTGLLLVLPPASVYAAIRRIGEARDLKAGPETFFPERNIVGCHLRRRDIEYFRSLFHSAMNFGEQELMAACRDEYDFVIVLPHGHWNFDLLLCHELAHVLFEYRAQSRATALKFWNAYTSQEREEIVAELKADGYQDYDFVDETFARIMGGAAHPPSNKVAEMGAMRMFMVIFRWVHENCTEVC